MIRPVSAIVHHIIMTRDPQAASYQPARNQVMPYVEGRDMSTRGSAACMRVAVNLCWNRPVFLPC
jgi:hypothetical protein